MKIDVNMHVLLLKGGDGSEREVSLNSAKECAKAIKKIGCKVTEVDISEINISSLAKINAPIFSEKDIPFTLKKIPAVKPGSRFLK